MDGMCGDRAFGPNGCPISIFQHFGMMLSLIFTFHFKYFSYLGGFQRLLSASFVAFIPKKASAFSILDFCPISLIVSIYKILAKVLANRLCQVLYPVLKLNFDGSFIRKHQQGGIGVIWDRVGTIIRTYSGLVAGIDANEVRIF